jgi:phage-related protein
MFAVVRSLIDLVAEIIGGVFRLVGTFVSSCFGLALAAMILIALLLALVLDLV